MRKNRKQIHMAQHRAGNMGEVGLGEWRVRSDLRGFPEEETFVLALKWRVHWV